MPSQRRSDEASRIAGIDVARGGWFFPRGGAISPAAICAAQCAAAGAALTRRFATQVARIEHDGRDWRAIDPAGGDDRAAPVVVLANAHDAMRLANLHGQPTRGVRGQLTVLEHRRSMRCACRSSAMATRCPWPRIER